MTLHIGWPQGIYLFLILLSVVHAIANHGKPREPYNGPLSFVGAVVAIGLLYWGGFFQ